MSDFDPAKEARNLSKHHVSLARWVDLEIRSIVSTTVSPGFVRTATSTALPIAWYSPYAAGDIDRSACGARTQRR
jgi:hypothetical protein